MNNVVLRGTLRPLLECLEIDEVQRAKEAHIVEAFTTNRSAGMLGALQYTRGRNIKDTPYVKITPNMHEPTELIKEPAWKAVGHRVLKWLDKIFHRRGKKDELENFDIERYNIRRDI